MGGTGGALPTDCLNPTSSFRSDDVSNGKLVLRPKEPGGKSTKPCVGLWTRVLVNLGIDNGCGSESDICR